MTGPCLCGALDCVACRGSTARYYARRGDPVVLPCPECDDEGPHGTNGDKRDPAARCRSCGLLFGIPEDES